MKQEKIVQMKKKKRKNQLHVSARKSVEKDVDVLRSQKDAPAVVGVEISAGIHSMN